MPSQQDASGRKERINALIDQAGRMVLFTQADEIVPLLREALTLSDRESRPVQWGALSTKLGEALMFCHRDDRATQVEEAIVCFRDALAVFDDSYAMPRAAAQFALGRAYAEMARIVPGVDEDCALEHYENAFSICTGDVPSWLKQAIEDELVPAWMNRRTGDRALNIERALGYATSLAAGRSRTETPDEWAMARLYLADIYRQRLHGDASENIEKGITLCRETLEALDTKSQTLAWAKANNALGTLYLVRMQADPAANIEWAIRCFLDASSVWTREKRPEEWAMVQNNLGAAWLKRLEGDYGDNVEEAIGCHEEALNVYSPEKFPLERAITRIHLGNAYLRRSYGRISENAETAIEHYRAALEIRRPENDPAAWASAQMNLAAALSARVSADRMADLDEGIRCLESARSVFTREMDPERWANAESNLASLCAEKVRAGATDTIEEAVRHFRQSLEVYAAGGFEEERRRVLGILGDLFFETERWTDAAHCFKEAIEIGEGFLASASTFAGRLEGVFHLGRFYPLLAYALLREGRPGEALLTLEHGKTRLFSGSGFHEAAEILALIPPRGALVAPLITTAGTAVYVIPYGAREIVEDHILWLKAFTEKDLSDLVQGPSSEQLGGWLAAYSNRRSEPSGWRDAVEDDARALWEHLMGAVSRRLKELNLESGAPVVILPEGRLGLLPLHAAWRMELGKPRYFIDDYTVLYAPSSYALDIARQSLQKGALPETRSLLLVVNPTCDLPAASFEGEEVAKFFEHHVLLAGADATGEAVKAAAPGQTCLHFACHGRHDWKTVMDSGVLLAGETCLTLGDLLDGLDLAGTRLVTLSACETATPRVTGNPNEFIGLSAGFLNAGASGVVGSLWAVEEISTALLIARFYRGYCEEKLDIPQALRKAQFWTRNLTKGEVASWLAVHCGKMKELPARFGRDYVALPDEAKPFQHPLYWAGFRFDGAWQ